MCTCRFRANGSTKKKEKIVYHSFMRLSRVVPSSPSLALLNLSHHQLHSRKVSQMTFFWNEHLELLELYVNFAFQKSVTNDIFLE